MCWVVGSLTFSTDEAKEVIGGRETGGGHEMLLSAVAVTGSLAP